MRKHRIPKWMNVLWIILVFSLTFSLIVVSVRRGYDLVQTLGFLASHFGIIFTFAVLAGVVLYGVSILLEGLEVHKAHKGKEDHSGDMANFVP